MLDIVSQGAKKLWHAKSGAAYCKYILLGIDDRDIINAISYHTTARAGMSQLEKSYTSPITSERTGITPAWKKKCVRR